MSFVKIFTSSAVYDQTDDDIDVDADMIRSRDRVRDQAEVFTQPREVNAMLDLIQTGPISITISHLEPACGNGNFLVEILRRKIEWIEAQPDHAPEKRAMAALIALSTTVGVDISVRNVQESHARMLEIARPLLHTHEYVATAEAILSSNIVVGDFLKCSGYSHPRSTTFNDTFSEQIRVIRIAPARQAGRIVYVETSGLIGSSDEPERVAVCDGPAGISRVLRDLAEIDECEILGRPFKVDKRHAPRPDLVSEKKTKAKRRGKPRR